MGGTGLSPRPRVGDILRRWRRSAGLTQEGLAQRAGYSTVYISMLERGERVPAPATIDALSRALDLPAAERRALESASRLHDTLEPIVGRSEELRTLEAHLCSPNRPVLLVSGEPGIGKTRLLQEAAALAGTLGMPVLRFDCERHDGRIPGTSLADAVTRYAERGDGTAVPDPEATRELSRTMARGVTKPVMNGDEPLHEPRLPADGLRCAPAAAAGGADVLFVLDNLHRAGLADLALLTDFVRSATHVRLVGAYRDSELLPGDPLEYFLSELARYGLARYINLRPLSERAAETLLGRLAPVEPALRARILQVSDGVPFYLSSYAEAVCSGLSGLDCLVPWDVVQSVRQRVVALPPTARDILGPAAVIGRHVPRALLGRVVRQPEEMLAGALEAACRARLLREDGADAYEFSHEIIREVVTADLGTARSALLHGRVGLELEALSGGTAVEDLAFHFARSDDVERAILYLDRAAGQALAEHAFASAERYYRELIAKLRGCGRTADAASACEKLGGVLAQGKGYDAAIELLETATTMFRALGDLEGEARATAAIGRAHWHRGTADEGIARLEAMIHVAREAKARALLQAALAPLYLARQRYEDQLAAAEEAGHHGRQAGDLAVLAQAEVWRGCALNQVGRVQEGKRVLEDAVPLAENSGDLVTLSHALNDLAYLSENGGDLQGSREWKRRALALAERAGDQTAIANLTFRCGQNAFLSGRWAEARAAYGRSLDLARRHAIYSVLPYPLFGLALLSAHEGDWEMACTLAGESSELAVASEDRPAQAAAESILAERDLHESRPCRAVARLLPFEDEEGLELRAVLPILADAFLAAGDLSGARDRVERALSLARSKGSLLTELEALRVDALVVLAEEADVVAADRILQDALSRATAISCPPIECRLRAARVRVDAVGAFSGFHR